MINVHNLTKEYKSQHGTRTILNNLNLQVAKGEMAAIMGPSGSGKTTLLKLMGGIIEADSGDIIVDGLNYSEVSESEKNKHTRSRLGFIYQDFRLLSQYSVLENVMLPLIPYQNYKDTREMACNLLKKFHIENLADSYPASISGGEKQRASIARALLHDPDMLLCDEPTGNLDSANRDHIMNLFVRLKKEQKSIIIVTHDKEVARVCDTAYSLRDGVLELREVESF